MTIKDSCVLQGLPVEVVVVLNDAVSTLIAGHYLDKKCRVGLILGE